MTRTNTIEVTDIEWETDGEDVDLPTTVRVPADLEYEIADYLSNEYGWLVVSFLIGGSSDDSTSCNGV